MINNVKTFPVGGIHPNENKLSKNKSIETLPISEKVIIPVSQQLGKPANPIVNVGDTVKVGQKIAEMDGFISANIHSSVSGTVTKIDVFRDSSGYKKKAIEIEVKDDIWLETIDRTPTLKNEITKSPEEIVNIIKEHGIVGLGGATFPTHVKYSLKEGMVAEYLIINGVECEPYLTSDHQLMLEKADEILIGINILMKALKVNTAIIGIENNKPDAIEKLSKLAENFTGITIQPLKVQYPQGAEKQLIEAVTKRQVPSGGLPIAVGCVVQNVATAFAVYEAVQKNKPLIERVVTVTGKSVKNPSNFLARIGTPLSMLIEKAGGMPQITNKVISGGPMMGKALASIDMTVTKGTSGILLMDEIESKREDVLNCIRCTRCVSKCPLGLEPYLLMACVQQSKFEQTEKAKVMDCCECGTCSYVCPAKRPLLDYMRLGKSIVGKIIRSRN